MDPRALPPRLVIDPSLPPEISIQLRSSPHVLRMARAGRRMDPTPSPTWLFVLPGLLLLIWLMTDSLAGVVVAGTGMGMIALLRWTASDAANRAAKRRLRLAYEHAGDYILPEDLDYPCQVLLRRAQDAAETILASQVHQAGLIDTIDNRVTLPEEVWQIAQRLAKLSAMHAEHGKLVPRDLPSGLEDAFKPYSTALDAAWTSLSKRVRNLEQYAKQVMKADKVFHAHRRLEALAARTPDYQQLVADTVRDDLARAHIKELAGQAAHVRKLFEESIHQAKQAAGELIRSPRV
ncbi:hypothetical protein [Nonomuraea sp. LPB2021202275-12-8]|uniref:hypothetical protein n=1 Tax=Nonomuraea sp. LPB2021202275-12-8 TaxID=3120159 RepID=UPI00300D8989